jgi:hypothetical protein
MAIADDVAAVTAAAAAANTTLTHLGLCPQLNFLLS